MGPRQKRVEENECVYPTTVKRSYKEQPTNVFHIPCLGQAVGYPHAEESQVRYTGMLSNYRGGKAKHHSTSTVLLLHCKPSRGTKQTSPRDGLRVLHTARPSAGALARGRTRLPSRSRSPCLRGGTALPGRAG